MKALEESGRAGGAVDIQILEFDCLLRYERNGYKECARQAHYGRSASAENFAFGLGVRVHGCLLRK
jgi:hypothetical protein